MTGPAGNPFASFEAFVDSRPRHGYRLILADPPWEYEMWARTGERRSPQAHYACHPLARLEALQPARLAARDCWLVLWSTFPHLPQAMALMRAWGFAYDTGSVWVKRTNSGQGWHAGTGFVLRGNPEPYLVGKLGRPPRPERVPRGLIFDRGSEEPGTIIDIRRRHSEKPEAIHAICEQLAGDGRCVELFARQARPGWGAWGDQLPDGPVHG